MIKITENPIDILKVVETASSLNAGAVNVFIGNVRNTASDVYKRQYWRCVTAWRNGGVGLEWVRVTVQVPYLSCMSAWVVARRSWRRRLGRRTT